MLPLRGASRCELASAGFAAEVAGPERTPLNSVTTTEPASRCTRIFVKAPRLAADLPGGDARCKRGARYFVHWKLFPLATAAGLLQKAGDSRGRSISTLRALLLILVGSAPQRGRRGHVATNDQH
jgi:hypothetical protein